MPQPDMTLTAEEVIGGFRAHWPMQYEITVLRLSNAKLAERISAAGGNEGDPGLTGIADGTQ